MKHQIIITGYHSSPRRLQAQRLLARVRKSGLFAIPPLVLFTLVYQVSLMKVAIELERWPLTEEAGFDYLFKFSNRSWHSYFYRGYPAGPDCIIQIFDNGVWDYPKPKIIKPRVVGVCGNDGRSEISIPGESDAFYLRVMPPSEHRLWRVGVSVHQEASEDSTMVWSDPIQP